MPTLPKNETEIDGLMIKTQHLSCMRALPMWIRILNVLSPLFDCLERLDKKTLESVKAKLEQDELTTGDVLNLLPVLAPYLRTLDADAVLRVAREVFVSTSVIKEGPDGKKQKIDLQGRDDKITAAFGPKLITMLKALWFVGKLNFEGFSAAGESGDSQPADAPST